MVMLIEFLDWIVFPGDKHWEAT